jgi:hypothetical protein
MLAVPRIPCGDVHSMAASQRVVLVRLPDLHGMRPNRAALNHLSARVGYGLRVDDADHEARPGRSDLIGHSVKRTKLRTICQIGPNQSHAHGQQSNLPAMSAARTPCYGMRRLIPADTRRGFCGDPTNSSGLVNARRLT